MDPFTGDIISIASIPDFNPNNYGNYKLDNYKNSPVVKSSIRPFHKWFKHFVNNSIIIENYLFDRKISN